MKRVGLILVAALLATAGGWWVVSSVLSQDTKEPSSSTPEKPRFAEERIPPEVKEVPFNGDRAMKYLRQLCDLGPRVSGSDAMRRQRELLTKHFTDLGATVTLQEFDAKQPSRGPADPIRMANMIITWHPEMRRRVILCGHYDTRPIADQEPRRSDWFKPFASANDGTSTVAWLMELAHHMKSLKSQTEVGVDFVLFDGEEYIYEDRHHMTGRAADRYFLGSEHFGAEYRKRNRGGVVYVAAVLLDLFAAKGATYPMEEYSVRQAGDLVQMVWTIAAQRGAKSFKWQPGPPVRDDHIALNAAGIPAIDIIDFDGYRAHWHRLSDTPDRCSGDQMAEVADVLTAWIQLMR